MSEIGSVDALKTSHRQAFEDALMRVLNTELAEQTFAQIVDGLPTRDSFCEFHWIQDDHPVNNHTVLCPGMIERAREFRSHFKADMLNFQLPACKHYVPLICLFLTFHKVTSCLL